MSDERTESAGGEDSALTRTAEVVGNAFGSAVNTVSETAGSAASAATSAAGTVVGKAKSGGAAVKLELAIA